MLMKLCTGRAFIRSVMQIPFQTMRLHACIGRYVTLSPPGFNMKAQVSVGIVSPMGQWANRSSTFMYTDAMVKTVSPAVRRVLRKSVLSSAAHIFVQTARAKELQWAFLRNRQLSSC